MFSEFLSFSPQGGGCGGGVFSQKVLMPGGRSVAGGIFSQKVPKPGGRGGVFSQKVLTPGGLGGLEVPIMHCSLHVISLLTCCQKEELEVCTCL